MSLQNKRTQLLGHEDHDDPSDDVDDIFSQYGAGDDEVVVSNSRPTDDVTIPKEKVAEIESVIKTMNEGVTVVVPDAKTEEDALAKDVFDTYTEKSIDDDTVVVPSVELPEKQWEQEEQIDEIPHVQVVSESVDPNPEPLLQEPKPVVAPQEIKKSYSPQEKILDKEIHLDLSKKTIMIVDDDADTLDMYTDIFEGADYNVIRASDGLEALNIIGDHTPHLIFAGIVMPRMDGFAMMEALAQNARTADIPVVINSHLGREADRVRAEELGAKDFIVRGFTPPRETVERIGALLMRSEYTFRFDYNEKEARKLAKDLGANNFFACPHGQEMVIKMSVADPKDLTFSARFSCVDKQKEE